MEGEIIALGVVVAKEGSMYIEFKSGRFDLKTGEKYRIMELE